MNAGLDISAGKAVPGPRGAAAGEGRAAGSEGGKIFRADSGMTVPAVPPADTLPTLIDRATNALAHARTSAEVLEARDLARAAYDAAKSAGRMARAKQAHDSIIADVHRAQAHSLAIRARAEIRLAEEYDAAQERGEVKRLGGDTSGVEYANTASAADLGLRRDEIHEARRFRDAERESPGLIQTALDGMIKRGEEPTKAELRRSVLAAVSENRRRPQNRNPVHVPDAQRDAVISFAGDCRRIAETVDLIDLAHWRGNESMARQARQQAGAARRALSSFIDEWDTQDAEK